MQAETTRLTGEFLRTVNTNDPDGFIALFADDAIVDDAGRIIPGRDAIREWAKNDIYAANVTFEVLSMDGDDSPTITAKVNGTFDRTGLPDPLIMTLHISALNSKITKLLCRLAPA